MAQTPVGIWFIGARGGVAATAIVGLAALRQGLVGTAGLVSELPAFADLGLAEWSGFVVGGHEIRRDPLPAEATKLASESRAVDRELLGKRMKSVRMEPGRTAEIQ